MFTPSLVMGVIKVMTGDRPRYRYDTMKDNIIVVPSFCELGEIFACLAFVVKK